VRSSEFRADPDYFTKLVGRESALLHDVGVMVDAGITLLDFGCGAGDLVAAYRDAGVAAFGCDIVLPDPGSERAETQRREGVIRVIPSGTYRLPFEDDTFDVVVSNQVFEHVMDFDVAIGELRRVTRPGGVGFHVFPARYCWREPHAYVPLATIMRSRAWLRIWAGLGIRNEFQAGLSAGEVARTNREYLLRDTNYPTRSAVRSAFVRHFASCSFVEQAYLRHHPAFPRTFGRLSPLMPLAGWLCSTFRARAVLVR
jgi:SAM-dependent methyltransferase